MAQGSGTLSAASAPTNSNGYAAVTLSVAPITASVQVSACVAPSNTSCVSFYANPVPLSQQQLEPVAGSGQVSDGQSFQPVVVRVTDSSTPPNPVLAAPVLFQSTVMRPGGSAPSGGGGETNPTNPAMPVILSVSQSNATSDINGLASITPSSTGFSVPLDVNVTATAGTTAQLDYSLELLPAPISQSTTTGTNRPIGRLPVWLARPVQIGGDAAKQSD